MNLFVTAVSYAPKLTLPEVQRLRSLLAAAGVALDAETRTGDSRFEVYTADGSVELGSGPDSGGNGSGQEENFPTLAKSRVGGSSSNQQSSSFEQMFHRFWSWSFSVLGRVVVVSSSLLRRVWLQLAVSILTVFISASVSARTEKSAFGFAGIGVSEPSSRSTLKMARPSGRK